MPWTIAQPRGENRPLFFPRSGPAPSHWGSLPPGATMTRPRPLHLPSLLALLALAVAACATERKPIRGFDKPPPGTIVLNADPGGTIMVWPVFALPDATQVFRPRLNGQDVSIVTSQEG